MKFGGFTLKQIAKIKKVKKFKQDKADVSYGKKKKDRGFYCPAK